MGHLHPLLTDLRVPRWPWMPNTDAMHVSALCNRNSYLILRRLFSSRREAWARLFVIRLFFIYLVVSEWGPGPAFPYWLSHLETVHLSLWVTSIPHVNDSEPKPLNKPVFL